MVDFEAEGCVFIGDPREIRNHPDQIRRVARCFHSMRQLLLEREIRDGQIDGVGTAADGAGVRVPDSAGAGGGD